MAPLSRRSVLSNPSLAGTIGGRAVIDKQTIHIHDLLAEPETEFPEARIRAQTSRRIGPTLPRRY